MKIGLDYGHGGRDLGAVYKDRQEAQDNLRLGKLVREGLEKRGVLVVETRIDNSYLSLEERSAILNKEKLDYVISLHRNSFHKPAHGLETYIYKNSNRAYDLAASLQREISDLGFKDRGLKRGNFYILRRTKAPAILLEVGFINSSRDNRLFDQNLNLIGKIIVDNILRFPGQ